MAPCRAWFWHRVTPMRKYDYTELIAWRRAMDLDVAVYQLSRAMPADERYGLTAQMRRAVVSVSANIAEGQRRRTDGEFLNSLSVAYGSIGELETHVMLAERLQFLSLQSVGGILELAAEVGRLINGLANSVKRRQDEARPGKRTERLTTDN
jgi:four helix bundle protein